MRHSLEIASDTKIVSQALRAIRSKRGMTVKAIAADMGMASRTYEEFEGGRGPMTHERIFAFAEITDSDPFALLLCPTFKSAAFAVDCADTKLVLILMMQLQEFSEREAGDIVYLEPPHIIGGSERLFRELGATLSNKETFFHNWLENRTGSIGLAALRLRNAKRRPPDKS
jgi:transcriptional regulator with XRE-family HTH domain